MSDVNYEQRLHGAWLAIQEIKNEPQFWDLFEGVWAELRDGLQEGEDPNEALEALVAYAFEAGHGDLEGYV